MKTCLPLVLLMTSAAAWAQTIPRAVEAYHGTWSGGKYFCELAYEVSFVDPNPSEDPVKCVADLQTKGRAEYQKAVRAVKKPSAQNLLKNFHAAWITSVRDMGPSPGETKGSYQRRKSETQSKLTESWQRFELELD